MNNLTPSLSLGNKRYIVNLLLIIALLAVPATVQAASSQLAPVHPLLSQLAAQHPQVMLSVIVQKTVTDQSVERDVKALGGRILKEFRFINAFTAQLPAHAINQLAQSTGVRYISLDGPMLSTSTQQTAQFDNALRVANAASIATDNHTVRDEFNVVAFDNNNGTQSWAAAWLEHDPERNGAGPTAGQVHVVNGQLSLDDMPDTNDQPSAARTVDLSNATSAILRFDFQTTIGVDSADAVTLDISNDGGANYKALETFTGIVGSLQGARNYDISPYISANTTIRFRVTNLYGASEEHFLVDNVQIAYKTGDHDDDDSIDHNPVPTNPDTLRYVRLVATSEVNGNPWTSIAELDVLDADGLPIPKTNWSIVAVDSEETVGEDGRAANAIDDDPTTFWHTAWEESSPTHPHEIVVDLGGNYYLSGFRYLARQDGWYSGNIANYNFYASSDGVSWGMPLASGRMFNTPSAQTVLFGSSQPIADPAFVAWATELGTVVNSNLVDANYLVDETGLGPDGYYATLDGTSTAALTDFDAQVIPGYSIDKVEMLVAAFVDPGFTQDLSVATYVAGNKTGAVTVGADTFNNAVGAANATLIAIDITNNNNWKWADFTNGLALAIEPTQSIYGLQGDDKKGFWRYNTTNNRWDTLRDTPDKVKEGGALVAVAGSNYIYALQGKDKKAFWRYNIAQNSWSALQDTPDKVKEGGALVTVPGSDTIYALQGDDKKGFWRYSIAQNSWSALQDTPDKVKDGGALAALPSNGYIYALQGDDKKDFWRYSIAQNNWSALQDTPDKVKDGGALVAVPGSDYIYALQGDDKKDFWRYSIAQNSWSALQDTPDNVKDGGALVVGGNDTIYALQGKDKQAFWRYSIAQNSWSALQDTPDNVKDGGALAGVPGSGRIYIDAVGLRVSSVQGVDTSADSLSTTLPQDKEAIDISNLVNTFHYAVRAPEVWNAAPAYLQGQGMGIAVVDSGIAKTQDLKNRNVRDVNFNEGYHNSQDKYGHGTFVASMIAGDGKKSERAYMGIAPKSLLYNLRVSDDHGMAYESDVVEALQWIYENKDSHNIRVVNLSLNSNVAMSYHVSPLNAALEVLWFNGIVVVVAAGNNGTAELYPPANDPFVITVGATDDQETWSIADDIVGTFSAYGTTVEGHTKPDLVAPGKDIVMYLPRNDKLIMGQKYKSHQIDKNYFRMSGTSMAAPIVAGAVAILLQDEPDLTPDQVKYRLMATANKNWLGYDPARAGAGYLDIYAAVNGTTTASANIGIAASQLLWSGPQPVTWTGINWNGVNWNAVSWNSVSWNSVSWNAVSWNSDYWDGEEIEVSASNTTPVRPYDQPMVPVPINVGVDTAEPAQNYTIFLPTVVR